MFSSSAFGNYVPLLCQAKRGREGGPGLSERPGDGGRGLVDRAAGPATVLGSVAPALLNAAEPQLPRGAVRVRYRRLAAGMAVTDGLAALVAFLSAYQINHGLRLPPGDFLAVMVVSAFTWIGLFAWFDLYGVHRLAPP